jgi:hypothetical protein
MCGGASYIGKLVRFMEDSSAEAFTCEGFHVRD